MTMMCIMIGVAVKAEATGPDIEGRYEVLQPTQFTETGDRIEVVEMFSYAGPACYRFLPFMEEFESQKPDYVEVRRVPVIFYEEWEPYAQAYYTAEALGIEKGTHKLLFQAIHEVETVSPDKASLAAFYELYGTARHEFEKVWDSFTVNGKMEKSMLSAERYGIRVTPTVIVNGKYRVTGRVAGGMDGMIEMMKALVEQEHETKERRS